MDKFVKKWTKVIETLPFQKKSLGELKKECIDDLLKEVGIKPEDKNVSRTNPRNNNSKSSRRKLKPSKRNTKSKSKKIIKKKKKSH